MKTQTEQLEGWTVAELVARRERAMAADELQPGDIRYTASDGTAAIRRGMAERWDELHDRLEAQDMCAKRDARLDAIIRRQR